ncbi:hypothetical protein D8B34_13835 [Verminephrobacter eiseniae]|nr:hypothetical protein [Verminephrobacter eiseniae]MCW8223169.1 hypothetical protein [Verminephrobacter eiseniae]MCW8234808.1 hypothetical protein [Verminephrobacter eiseniae]
MKWPNKAGGNARPAQLAAIGWCGSARLVRHSLRPHSSYSISKSFGNAKAERRQYRCTASDADKGHGWFRNGIIARKSSGCPFR